METLKLGKIICLYEQLKKSGMDLQTILDLPIYIGDDDELNGIHNAWCLDKIQNGDPETQLLVELIEENSSAIPLKKGQIGILIS